MKQLTTYEIERIAADVFKNYKNQTQTEWDVIYVDPQELAEMLGFKLINIDFGEDSDILGFTSFNEFDTEVVDINGKNRLMHLTDKSIIINKSLQLSCLGRYNFTIMHEIAHHIINQVCSAGYHVKFRYQPHYEMKSEPFYTTFDYDETLANELAAAILMPKDILTIVFQNVFGRAYVKRINSFLDRKEYRGFCAIAKLFGVSKEALSIRLRKLGMIGEYQYWTHNEMIDVYFETKTA